MKLKTMFMTLGLAAAVGVGVFAGVSAGREVKEVKADSAPYVGSVCIEFQNSNSGWYWDDNNAKVAFYAWSGETNGWSNMIQTTAGTHRYEITYSLSFNPAGKSFKLVRYPSSHSDTPDWDNDKWGDSGDRSFSQAVYWWGNDGSFQNQVDNYIKSSGAANNVRLSYNKFGENVEAYRKTVSIAKDETFEINFNGTDYHELKDGVDSTYFTVVSDKIKCHVTGTYDLYFDTSTHKLWAQVDAATEAAGFAQTLLTTTNTICATGGTSADHSTALAAVWNPKATPDGTSLVEKWNALTAGAKTEFANATPVESGGTVLQEGVYRYRHIMDRYGPNGSTSKNLQAFTGGPSLSRISIPSVFNNVENSNMILVVVIVSAAALTAIGGYLLIKRRKQDR